MATFTSTRGEGRVPPVGAGYGGAPVWLRSYINIAANPADGDIYQMVNTPDKFLLWGGWFGIDDIDTGTEAVDIDVGWAANGTSSAATIVDDLGNSWTDSGYTADPDGLCNVGVLTGDPITDLLPAGNVRLIMPGKPLYFHKKTMLQLEANVAAATFAAGNASLVVFGEIIDGAVS